MDPSIKTANRNKLGQILFLLPVMQMSDAKRTVQNVF